MAKKFIVAVDLGGTNLKVGLLNLKPAIIARQVLSTGRFTRKEALICAIVEAVKGSLKSYHLANREILGVGLGVPGPIDVPRGVVHFFPNIPGWKEVPLKSILQKELNLPVFLDNDANLMCLAEYKLGAAQKARNALCITLGTGVGGGLIIDTRPYRANSFAAGEIGHLPINESGPRCNCGGTACLEVYIGNNRIKARAKMIFRRRVSLEELSVLARAKNKKAIRLWAEVAGHLATALVGAVNLLNLDCVVIGGGVANAGEVLFGPLRKTVARRAMSIQARRVKILKAKLGNDAGLIGAAILVKESAK